MEYRIEDWIRLKEMRYEYSRLGWALLTYLGIMNLSVLLLMLLDSFHQILMAMAAGASESDMAQIEAALMENSGWGYFLAIGIGAVFLLFWKKPRFCFGTIWQRGKPMKFGSFLAILAIFTSGQLIFQILTYLLELIFNQFGMSLLESMESSMSTMDSLSMFLYVGLGAPVAEEILFRGLILRGMEPYGKKFAIFASSLLFGLFHGNLYQTPYAFAVGLVLGYVAAEYSIAWAMVLHMFNNLTLTDTLYRIAYLYAPDYADLILWAVIIVMSAAALIVMLVKRRQIGAYLRSERMDPLSVKAFFTAPGIIGLLVILGLSIVLSVILM